MSPTASARVVVVGAGHLAWHLAPILRGAGYHVDLVSRNPDAPGQDASTRGYDDLADLSPDLVFLAVPDNHIAGVSKRLTGLLAADVPVFHTSGATPTERIDAHFKHRGVLWPIRSLRSGETVTNWRDLPLVVSASTPSSRELIVTLARKLSDTVKELNDTQRAQLHLAAVFSNNFVTWLYQIAYELCTDRQVPFELLLPIIRATARRQDELAPATRQTGAAIRGDTATIERHLGLLEKQEYRELYRRISDLILEYRQAQHNADLGGDLDVDLQD